MYPSWVSWCFDSARRPVCSSLWDDRYECSGSACPFSHVLEAAYSHCTCSLPLRLLEESADLNELVTYLTQTASPEEADTNAAVDAPGPTQSDQDEEDVRRTLQEMQSFEEETRPSLCQYYLETGNCLRMDTCPCSHGKGEVEAGEEVRSRWYPNYRDCTCCQGWVFQCKEEVCRLMGACQACQRFP